MRVRYLPPAIITAKETGRGKGNEGERKVHWKQEKEDRMRGGGEQRGEDSRRLDGEIFQGWKMRFAPLFSPFLAHEIGATAVRPFFQNSRPPPVPPRVTRTAGIGVDNGRVLRRPINLALSGRRCLVARILTPGVKRPRTRHCSMTDPSRGSVTPGLLIYQVTGENTVRVRNGTSRSSGPRPPSLVTDPRLSECGISSGYCNRCERTNGWTNGPQSQLVTTCSSVAEYNTRTRGVRSLVAYAVPCRRC